jgi:hypothetical protein
MRVENAFVGARGIDSEPYSRAGDPKKAVALKASGIDFVVLYLSDVSKSLVAAIVDAELAFMPVTHANQFDGAAAVAHAASLSLPKGCTIWLDVEGPHVCPPSMQPTDLIAKIDSWANTVSAAGYEPGIYVGAPQPLTSSELTALKVVRYWRAASRVLDRSGQLAEPASGWCMFQGYPSRDWAGVWSDVDFIYEDYHERLPHWVVA